MMRSGRASVEMSKSLAGSPSSRSRTQPPTHQAWCPAARNFCTTARASASSSAIRLGSPSTCYTAIAELHPEAGDPDLGAKSARTEYFQALARQLTSQADLKVTVW